MKRVFALLGILISLFLICGYIACSKIEYTSIDYGDWNDRTKAILANQFEGILPNNTIIFRNKKTSKAITINSLKQYSEMRIS